MIGNREERGEGREAGKEGEKEGKGKRRGKGHLQSGHETCIFPRHTWGKCGTHGANEFLEVLPGFA